MTDAFPYNEENKAKILKLAEWLQGSCRSLDDGIEAIFGDGVELQELDTELLRELDDITMECQGCNWWCETSELNDDQVCTECAPAGDE